jgi:hypothetical protein
MKHSKIVWDVLNGVVL